MIKTTCFAHKDGQCTALKKISCDGCGFYKPATVNNQQLTKINGTTDIERICWKHELKQKNEERRKREEEKRKKAEEEKRAKKRIKDKLAKKIKYHEDKLDDLCVAIIRQAVDDWRYLHAGGQETDDCNFNELTEFFDNNCGGLLANINIDEYKLFTYLLQARR